VYVHEDRIGIWSVGFCGGRKTGEPGEKPSEQEREPTTNSTQNPGHIGGRRVLSPLRHSCSPTSSIPLKLLINIPEHVFPSSFSLYPTLHEHLSSPSDW